MLDPNKAVEQMQSEFTAGFQAGAASRDAVVAELKAERDAFYMDYRIKCDTETKELHLENDQLRSQIGKLREALGKHLNELMNIAVSNGANSVSMPDDYVATALLLSETPEQSLAAYRNKVIEECAEKLEQQHTWITAISAANLLRVMKEQP